MKESYQDQIKRLAKKARKERNAEALVYYTAAQSWLACVSFERYRGSWVFEGWRKANENHIKETERNFKRLT